MGMVLSTATDDVRFQLRHRNTILYPPSIMAYVDQPPRIHPIRLTWTPPGTAAYPEDPAMYTALWVDETHRLAEQDHIRLLSRETSMWFSAQDMPTDDDPETFLRLYMAHDSVLYQRWTHAILTYDMLHLTRTAYVGGPRSLLWPCDEYDTAHRCVVANVTLHLVYNNNHPTGTTVVIPRMVLDWDASQSQAPPWMYGAIRYGHVMGTPGRLVGVKLVDTWIIQDGDVAIDDSEPILAAGMDNDTFVLGRRLLWRTFNVFAFDAAEATWTLNRVVSGYDVVVVLLQVTVLVQSVLLGYHATSVYMLTYDKIVRSRITELALFEPEALGLRDRLIIVVSLVLSMFQIVGAVWVTGSGPYTDRDLTTYLGRLTWIIVAVAGWQLLSGLAFYAVNRKMPPGHERGMLNVLGHGSYIKLALLGELAALLPDAVQSKYFLLAAACVATIFVIPSFCYTTLCLMLTGAAGHGAPPDKGRRVAPVWLAGVMELLATLTFDAGCICYLFRPTLYQHQVLWSLYAVWCLAICVGLLALMIPIVVVFIQSTKGVLGRDKAKQQ